MLLGKEQIREIVERTDIVALVGRHVRLRKAGRSFVGLCPFHGERTPSFYVTPERHGYRCFGCGASGDAIAFVMEYEGKDFPTAARELAQLAGIQLQVDPEENRRLQERRALLWACEVAARFFEETLWSPAGAPGRAHLAARGVSEATARAAGLGYAPAAWQALTDRLQREGVPLPVAVTAGLIGTSDGDRHYDTFRGRVMVPIRDPDGRVIAFGGRIVEGDDARKYINSRETPLYTKSRVLYGLDQARQAIRRGRSVTLVEGYFDAIALWEAGIADAVALCSTVLTPEHVRLLERLQVERIDVLLDGDEAGRRGAVKLAGPILAAGKRTRVVALPAGHDPDTFLRAHGAAGYAELLEDALPLSAFVIEAALEGAGAAFEERLHALAGLRPVVAALPEGAARSLFLGEVASRFALPPADVAAFFRGDLRREAPAAAPARQQAPRRRGPSRGPQAPARRRELELVASLLAQPALRRELGGRVAAQLDHPDLRELAGLLAEGALPDDELLARLEPAIAQALLARLRALREDAGRDWRREIEDGLLHVQLERLQAERQEAIAARDRLELELLRSEAGTQQHLELAEAIREYRAQADALRGEMERLRERLRGAA